MKRTPQFNNFSEKLTQTIRDKLLLKKGETRRFVLLNIKDDPDNPGRKMMPSVCNVPSLDRIWDDGDQSYKDIAFISSIGLNGEIQLGQIDFLFQNNGEINLKGGIAEDQEKYEYLMLTNYNASKKNRDTSRIPLFKLDDPKMEARRQMEERNYLKAAISKVDKMTDEEIQEFIWSTREVGANENDPAVLRNEAERIAQEKPKYFMEVLADKTNTVRAAIRMANKAEGIRFDVATSQWLWCDNNQPLCQVARGTGKEAVEELVHFIMKANNGQTIVRNLQKIATGRDRVVEDVQASVDKPAKRGPKPKEPEGAKE